MSDEDVPAVVREAQELVARQRTYRTRMAVGAALCGALSVAISATPWPEYSIVPVFAMMLTVAFFLSRVIPNVDAARRAQALLGQWDARQLGGIVQKEAPSSDPRAQAVRTLVARIRELGDARAKTAVASVEERLTGLMKDVEMLGQALADDAAVGAVGGAGGESSPRRERLQAIRDQKEAQIRRVLDAVRDLHAELAAREAGAHDPVAAGLDDVLLRLEAEAEVDRGDPAEAVAGRPLPKAPIAAGTSARQRPRQTE